MFIYCDIMLVSLSYDYVYKWDMITIAAVALTWYNQELYDRNGPVCFTGRDHR